MAARRKTSEATTTSSLAPLGKDWEDRLAPIVTTDAASAAGTGGWPWISTRGGHFTFNGDVLESPLRVVILAAMRWNLKYEGAYDPEVPASPVCYAYADGSTGDGVALAPPSDLETKLADSCGACWANAFGSGDKGRGKACKNTVRLALLPFDAKTATAEGFAKVEGARLQVPVTSVKTFGAYVQKLTKGLRLPLLAVVTQVGIEPDARTQFRLTFSPEGTLRGGSDVLDALLARREEALETLRERPSVQAEAPPASTSKARGAARVPARNAPVPPPPARGRRAR